MIRCRGRNGWFTADWMEVGRSDDGCGYIHVYSKKYANTPPVVIQFDSDGGDTLEIVLSTLTSMIQNLNTHDVTFDNLNREDVVTLRL